MAASNLRRDHMGAVKITPDRILGPGYRCVTRAVPTRSPNADKAELAIADDVTGRCPSRVGDV